MKKLQYSACAMTLAALMSMTACQSEDVAPVVEQSATQDVVMTFGVGLGEETRTIMSEDGRNLKTVWEDDDVIIVLGKDDEPYKPYGTLKLTSGAGDTRAIFEGKLKNVPSERSTFTFLYAGNGSTLNDLEKDSKNPFGYNVDISKQQGILSRLTDNDVLFHQGWYTPSDGQIVVSSVTLERHTGFAHFSLKFPTGVKRNGEKITISNTEGKLFTQYKLAKNDEGEYSAYSPKTPANITIEPDAAAKAASDYDGNEVYVMFLPTSSTNSFDLNFSVEIGGKTYTGHLDKRTNGWTANEYVNVAAGQGIVVNMTTPIGPNHSRNPLKKWAKSDLKRVGNDFDVTGEETGDYTISGYYYQFGRNYGYEDATEAQTLYASEKYSSEYNNTLYGVFNGLGNGVTIPNYDSELAYNYPNIFYIDHSDNGDYKSPSRQDSWAARANWNGFKHNTPCPTDKKWKIPSKDDFKEILPYENNAIGVTGSTAWNTRTAIKLIGKENEEKVPCAFRWSKYTESGYSYLKIECLVLASEDSTPDWTDSNVVKRYFKLAGCITPFLDKWSLTDGYTVSYQYSGRPLDFGSYGGDKVYASSGYCIKIKPKSNWMKLAGFYWTSDASQGIFTLNTSSADGLPVGYYVSTQNLPIAANIRCILEE